jgi:hypothetical protein
MFAQHQVTLVAEQWFYVPTVVDDEFHGSRDEWRSPQKHFNEPVGVT